MHTISRDTMLRILRDAAEQGAEEIHFKVPNRPLLRMPQGALVPMGMQSLSPSDTKAAVFALCALGHLELPVANITDHEFSFGINGLGRYRAYIYRQRGSLGAVVRRVNTSVPPLEQLGLTPEVDKLVGLPGLTLVAGQLRTEILHSLIHGYNGRARAAVWILETPLTYLHRDGMAAISHREVGADLPDYATGMSQAIRLGADLIAVGDVPDVESARKLLDAAERRVPVIASVGAPSAEEATWWLLRMFFGQERDDTERRIQTVLRSVIASSPQSKAQVIVSKKKAPRLSAVGT